MAFYRSVGTIPQKQMTRLQYPSGRFIHEELVSTGQAKHDELVAEASARHEQMITEARERSTGMVAEAQQRKATVLHALAHERDVLQKKIEELRTFERDYRARLKSYLEGQLHELSPTGTTADAEGGAQDGDVQQQERQQHNGEGGHHDG